tara:strand:+ start:1987 stop:3483 length:1497 start_codon:yes stop_codon:yes gene_type:complete
MPTLTDLSAPSAKALKAELRGRSSNRRRTLSAVSALDNAVGISNRDPLPDLGFRMRPIASLKPAKRRVRKTNPAQLARVKASIDRFGFIQPVLLDREERIIAGHVAVEAAKALGLEELPAVQANHLSDEDARLLAISLNRLAETGEWDETELVIELKELEILDAPLILTGFDQPILDGLMTDTEVDIQSELDRVPLPVRDIVSRKGEIWSLGDHLLACGDARDAKLVAELLNGERARLALIDPPYNVPIAGHVSSQGHAEFAMGVGEWDDDEFTAFLRDGFAPLIANLLAGGILMCCMDWRGVLPMTMASRSLALEQLNLIVWAKPNGGMGSLWRSQHELIGVFKKPGAPHINNVELGKFGRWRSNVWTYPGANIVGSEARSHLKDHPTPKPVALLSDAMLDVTHRGDIVVDTFTGSGSTLVACEHTGRRFRGIEFEPRYVDVAIRRWQKATGRSATLLDGTTFDEVARRRRACDEGSPAAGAKPRIRVKAASRGVDQ